MKGKIRDFGSLFRVAGFVSQGTERGKITLQPWHPMVQLFVAKLTQNSQICKNSSCDEIEDFVEVFTFAIFVCDDSIAATTGLGWPHAGYTFIRTPLIYEGNKK